LCDFAAARDVSRWQRHERQLDVPFDFGKEVGDQSAFRHAVDLGVDVLELETSVVAFAISVIVRIVNDVNQAVVAHATRERWLDDIRVFAPSDLPWNSVKRVITHLDIVIEIVLQQQPTPEVMLNMSWASPGVALRCLKADVRWVSERRIDTIQMPVRVAEVALEHLALVATGHATLHTENRFVALEDLGVVGSLIPVATAFRAVVC
jgi:hypothetical protein